jgi:acyl carrier protein
MTTVAPWLAMLRAAAPAERRGLLEDLVTAAFRRWLQMEDDEPVPTGESYFALGLTSLGAVELQQHLEQGLGRRIDSTRLYNHPTLAHLVSHLCEQVLPELFPPKVAAVSVTSAPAVDRHLLDQWLQDLHGR